jgi:RNA polymerase sigma-70 factor, ECF subfamily
VNSSPEEVTSLLKRLSEGDHEVAAKLVSLVYDDLHRIAASRLRNERADHTLQTTALVHEAYMRMTGQRNANWQNRNQFFAVASQVMRRILVDYARAQQRARRGGKHQKVLLEDVLLVSPERTNEVLAVNESLSKLEQFDPRQGRIVELRYFGGLTIEEIAEVLDISGKTVARELNAAKAWLYGELKQNLASSR